MVSIKKESKEDFESDIWLRDSVEVKEEDSKADLGRVKCETEESKDALLVATKSKNSKRSFEDLEENADSSDESAAEMSKSAHPLITDEVGDLCRYKCRKCGKDYQSMCSLQHHLKKAQHWQERSSGELSGSRIKTVWHQCRICAKKILCEKCNVQKHLKKCHFINRLAEYQSKQYYEESKRSQNGRTSKNISVSEAVGNLCRYKCPTCGNIYTRQDHLSRHLSHSKHNVAFNKQISCYLVEKVLHKCKICSKEILCEKKTIQHHLKHHKINTIKDYANNTFIPHNLKPMHKDLISEFCRINATKHNTTSSVANLCIFSCQQCNYSCCSYSGWVQHRKRKNEEIVPLTHYLTKTVFHKCHVCQELIICDNAFIKGHLKKHNMDKITYTKRFQSSMSAGPKELYITKLKSAIKHIPAVKSNTQSLKKTSLLTTNQTTNDSGNICFFKCPLCCEENMSFNCLRAHYKKEHKNEKLSYRNMENYIMEARYHQCLICCQIVLCDIYFLTQHLCSAHKMKYSQYTKDNVLSNGGKVFPTFKGYLLNGCVLDNIDKGKKELTEPNDNGLIVPSMLSSESEDSDFEAF